MRHSSSTASSTPGGTAATLARRHRRPPRPRRARRRRTGPGHRRPEPVAALLDVVGVRRTAAALRAAFARTARVRPSLHTFAVKAASLVPVLAAARPSEGSAARWPAPANWRWPAPPASRAARIVLDSPAKTRAELREALALGIARQRRQPAGTRPARRPARAAAARRVAPRAAGQPAGRRRHHRGDEHRDRHLEVRRRAARPGRREWVAAAPTPTGPGSPGCTPTSAPRACRWS